MQMHLSVCKFAHSDFVDFYPQTNRHVYNGEQKSKNKMKYNLRVIFGVIKNSPPFVILILLKFASFIPGNFTQKRYAAL
jgi:Na+/melibiose symporter-like transporter